MASPENALPTCPVCHRSDQVKTTQTAYNTGVARCAPPDMPTRNVSMIPYIGTCMFLVGIFIFLTVVFVGGLENGLPLPLQLTLAIVTIITIITALVVSYYAFQKVVRGDVETTLRFPAWDHAMATWKNFYYCKRDDVIFDPKTNKVVSEEQVAALRNLNVPEGQAQSALASH